MVKMTKKEIRKFLKKGTFTGKLATVKKDGNSHVVPIWFVLSDQNSDGKLEDIYLTTGIESVKATKIAGRYMGKKKASKYGRINSGEGAVLVRIRPKKIIAEKDIAILS